MPDTPLNLEAYFERIQYHGPTHRSSETLCQLHRQQAFTIPFENLDIHLGRPINIDPARIVAKLVDEKRGGYCYELNGLFELVLENLGFPFTPLAARNAMSGPPYRQKSHKLLLVEVEQRPWLADLGFSGIGLIEPIPFVLDTEFRQSNDTFRLQAAENGVYHLQRKLAEEWQSLYAFTLEMYYPADYCMMNYFNSTSPNSAFTNQRTCAMPTPEARILLSNFELKIRSANETITRHIENEDAYREALQTYFEIVLPHGTTLKALPSTSSSPVI
jgi:N-hydroxyarylamine O-acetyltransferase